MMHGIYVGKEARLRGKGALLRPDEATETQGKSSPLLLAQFDDMELTEAFGWHLFDRNDFNIDQD